MTPTRSRRTIRPHWPPGITKKNAAQRIFNIPELVSETVHWQVQGLDDFMYKVAGHRGKEAWEPYVEGQAGYLYRFATLNRALYTKIIQRQRTWKNTMGAMDTPAVSRSLDVIFAKVPAGFRPTGELVTVLSLSSYGRREPEWRWPLHGLPEDWAKLFRRISVLFLNLEKVEIGHNVLVADKVVKNFARRYPAPKDP
ncbi:hypothetical protein CBS147333_1438 [Penicillium roqueforti]|nr:hypothetical protein CBS147333_1438 [Penicillium roqueforti]KAI3202888.1 hypothetical protein CBS147311_4481 [Penicillium roqueforti]KAI3278969.1 hypothetical protein CBS147308_310 [Penicillium roqueforti]KAI3293051.1 hypothetical protein DTO003C3_3351 [Penicillium roqueforti]